MKSIVKKLMVLLFAIPMLNGCSSYRSDASPKEDFVGTYKLKTITKNRNQKEDPYDYKAEIGAEAYFALDADGYVYYAYKDNQTELSVKRAYAIFTKDEEDDSLYKAIEINDGVTSKYLWEKEVGCMDEPTMGFQNNGRKSWFSGKAKDLKQGFAYTIHYAEPKWTNSYHEIKYQYVYYEKISNDGTLQYLNSLLGTNYHFDRPFELQNVHGYYAYRAQKNGMENTDAYLVKDYVTITVENEIGEGHNILARLNTEKYREKLNAITNLLHDEIAKGSSTVSAIVDIITTGYNDIVENLNAADNSLNISKFDATSIAQLKSDFINELKSVYCDDSGNITNGENLKTAISKVLDLKEQNIAFGYGTISDTQYGVFENSEVEYAIIDMDSYSNGTVKLYYSEKSEPGMKQGSASITFVDNPGAFKTSILTVLGKQYYCYNTGSIGYIFHDNVVFNPEDVYTSQEFSWVLDKEGHSIEDVLEALGVGK